MGFHKIAGCAAVIRDMLSYLPNTVMLCDTHAGRDPMRSAARGVQTNPGPAQTGPDRILSPSPLPLATGR